MKITEIMRGVADHQWVRGELARRDREDDGSMGFDVLSHDPNRHSPERPLVILIHPGDMIESPAGFLPPGTPWWVPQHQTDDTREYRQVRDRAIANQSGTAKELQRWRSRGADVVVLHRGSCSQFDRRPVKPEAATVCWDLELAVEDVWGHGSVLFGDDLAAAVAWMIEHLHIQQRPRIFFAGAYSGDTGCLTYVVNAISRIYPKRRITITKFSPQE